MDEESENMLPASIHLGELHGTANEGTTKGSAETKGFGGTGPGDTGSRSLQRPLRTEAASLGSGRAPLR